ncbi:Xanthine dehydrogenase family protein molybdopterin-binding subunit [Rubrivivax sp. A210]|uniref:xanthine dehydrogenase family protein molybdopterin-binding subunit n=1 Tax=Rubrivivax sp. A210 TaxID=2772301 RepID=UPI00191873CD|nr:xanthine dehydrogenase family protein molybdopterin-binding subunit [Rubrivivax sp. A210]CAD5371898.1 Xanthine dehydrogenase family protein molybdopterin-binding subunit [Rubrivivax sp. A210]
MNAAADAAGRYGSGAQVRRIEDPALVQGRGRYTGDVTPEGAAHLRFVRSTQAHGRILGIDSSAALAVPGVLAVYTGADLAAAGIKPLAPAAGFRRPDGSAMDAPARPVLAQDIVRFVGEAVALVVAESREAARAAADAVVVDIEALPAVADALAAVAEGAEPVWPGAHGNVLAQARHGDAAAAEAAFARAAHRVQLDLVNQRLAPATMEPRSVLAWLDEGRLTMRLSSQMPSAVRDGLAACLGLQAEDVRVLVGDVGGGFGMKTGIYPEDVAVAFAARQLARPVKWQAERVEDFLAAVHGRDLLSHAELALDADGRVLALRLRSLANVGAYPTTPGVAIQLLIGPWVTTSIYDIPVINLDIRAVLSHTAPTGPYRGAGRPEAIYATERLMDAAARAIGMDGAELRRRNMIRPEQMPYRNAMGQTYDSGQFARMLDQGLELADWGGYAARREASRARGLLRGRGIATFLEWTGANALEEQVQVRVTADGFVELTSATMAMGQGIATSYAQLAVDVFGVPLERIRILQGDTDRANGFGSAGSRSLFTGGAAVQVASKAAVDQGKELAAQALEAPAADIEYAAGRYTVAGTDLGIGLFDLARRQPAAVILAEGGAKAAAPSWPNGCHVCEVEIDPATGQVRVVAYASVNDIGRIVSPTIVRGQVEGGALQGMGQALCERMVYDEQGQLLSASFMDYALPGVDSFRGFKTAFDESVPCLTNGLGSKGVGELGTIGATPAVVNAVVDALAQAGQGRAAERVQMPLTAETVWRALRGEYPAFSPLPALPG